MKGIRLTIGVLFMFVMSVSTVWANNGESDIVYTDYVVGEEAATADGTSAKPYKNFTDALDAVANGGTIIIGENGAFVNEINGLSPLVIDKEVTITSENGKTLNVRTGGILLGADVTFENVCISLQNRHNNAIFANGYTLTMKNVSREDGSRDIHLFAGGLADDGIESGTCGEIVLHEKAKLYGNIYAGSMNESSSCDAVVTIYGTTSMELGDIYACGAQTGFYEDDDLFSGVEPLAPVASQELYPVSGNVEIELQDSNLTKAYGLTGSEHNAKVTFSSVYAREMSLYDLDTLTVKSGKLIPLELNENVNVSIESDGILDLSKVTEANNGEFTVTDFAGGGVLRLGPADELTITGEFTGETVFEVSDESVLEGSGIAEENHTYIETIDASGDGSFLFTPYSTQGGMELINIDGFWMTTEPMLAPLSVLTFDVTEDVKTNGLNISDEVFANGGQVALPVTGSFAEEDAYSDIGFVDFSYQIESEGEEYWMNSLVDEYDYHYVTCEELNLKFCPMGTFEDGEAKIWISKLNEDEEVRAGEYVFTIHAPTKEDRITVQAFLIITGDDITVRFDGGVQTYLGETQTNEFVYGDDITLKVIPVSSTGVIETGDIALFVGDTQISEEHTAINGRETSFTIHTEMKQLLIGENRITVKYQAKSSGIPVVRDYSEDVIVNLNKAQLSTVDVDANDKVYDGTAQIQVKNIVLDGISIGDDIWVDVSVLKATVASADAGTYDRVMLSNPVLKGTSAKWYYVTVPANGVELSNPVSIKMAEGAAAPQVKGSYTTSKKYKGNYTYTITPVKGAEYQMDGCEEGKWTSSNVFDNLKPGSRHTFYVRIKATKNQKAGSIGRSAAVNMPYQITYKLNGGKNNSKNPTAYYNQKITLKNPTRKGYSFKGWYTDSKFKKKITTIKKGAEGNYTLYAKWEKITVKKAAISSAKNSKKGQIVLNCKKLKDVKGYEISYSTVKNFKKDVVTKDTKKNTYTIKKLKKGTTYYVKIRAYQLDSTGKKVYGKYSAVKKVKITK